MNISYIYSFGLGCGEHGTCFKHPTNSSENFCICESGWQGESCDHCKPFWKCPQPFNVTQGFSSGNFPSCVNPNECICATQGLSDPNGLCGHPELGGKNWYN